MQVTPAPRIVVGVDGSASSVAALNWAAHQADLTGARLEAVTAWQWPSKYQWMRTPPDYDPAGDAQKGVDAIIDEVRSAHPSVPFSRRSSKAPLQRCWSRNRREQSCSSSAVGDMGSSPACCWDPSASTAPPAPTAPSWCCATRCRWKPSRRPEMLRAPGPRGTKECLDPALDSDPT